MQTYQKEKLEELGVDIKRTLDRFLGNEELYFRFLKKLEKDKTCEGLRASIEDRNYEEAFKYAHTLKGLIANLGLEDVAKPIYKLTELLRKAPYEEAEIVQEMELVER